jgi:hypothetical protein
MFDDLLIHERDFDIRPFDGVHSYFIVPVPEDRIALEDALYQGNIIILFQPGRFCLGEILVIFKPVFYDL